MSRPDPIPDPYAWTEADYGPLANGAAVTLINGRTPEEALCILGPDHEVGPAPAEEIREWANAQDYHQYGTALEAGELGNWTLVVELNGYRSTEPGYAATLSEHGETVVVYQNINAFSRFIYARGGQVLRDFDPLADSDDAEFRLPQEEGITFPGEGDGLHPMRGSFLLMERITGVRINAQDIEDAGGRIAVGLRH